MNKYQIKYYMKNGRIDKSIAQSFDIVDALEENLKLNEYDENDIDEIRIIRMV